MASGNLETVRSMYEGFARGDMQAVLRPCHPQVEWWEAENFIYADGNPYVGPKAVLEGVFLRLAAEWEGFTVAPQRFLDAGETIAVHGYYSGTCKATGRRVRAQFAHFFTLKDRQLLHFQQFTDTAQFQRAVQ